MRRFLIIRLSSLGDIIHTLPAFSALRKKYPDASISWVVEEKGKDILDCVPGIDNVIVVRVKGWHTFRRGFRADFSRLKKELRNEDRIALDFQGLVKSAVLAFLSDSSTRIGFARRNLREPLAGMFYTERVREIPETLHVIEKNLRLLTALGIDENTYDFPLLLPDETTARVRGKLRELGYDKRKKLIVYNVGAAWRTKRWFPEKWAALAELMKREEFFPLLLWGNEEEKALALEIRERTDVPLAPYLSLQEVMALVKESDLLISGDTFALQAACAFSRPLVGIFGPTNPRRNGPFSPRDRVAFHPLKCSHCYKRTCSSLECLKRITPEEVAGLSFQLLEKND